MADQLRDVREPEGSVIRIDDDRITVDGRQWDPGEGHSIYDQLIYVLMQVSLDNDPDRLHLHTGLVARNGGGLLIGGIAGCGKSTLIAQLVRGGFDYCTDERVAIDRAGSTSALEKPISVVQGSFAVLHDFDPANTGRGSASPRLWHVPASALRGGVPLAGNPPITAIALVEYRPGSPIESVPMHPVTVARVLLADAIDRERFGADGTILVTRLCASVPCVSMIHGGQETVVDACASLIDQARAHVSSDVVEIIGAERSTPQSTGPIRLESILGIAPGTRGALAAERMLLCAPSGALVELDEPLAAWLQLLDGETPLKAIVDEVAEAYGLGVGEVEPMVLASVSRLVELGVAS